MPALTAAQLNLLRAQGHETDLYLVIQQPMYRQYDAWAGYYWSCQVNGAPAGAVGDLTASITVDNAGAATTLYDGMTVFIGSSLGAHDRGIFRVRSDQAVGPATVNLDIGASSEIVGVVQNDDWIVGLDEFRVCRRDPRITEAGGVLSWFKDYDLTYAGLGATAAQRREASLPPVPIMGPHRVVFVDPGSSVDLTFDWSSSYATYPGATVNDWDAYGEDGGAGWAVLNNATPPAQTYANISGLAGYRVRLEIGSDVNDPPVQFRRGVRYVFTLRRPGETQAGDPPNAEPITAFELQGLLGAFEQGYWHATIRVYGEQAHEYEIMPGALVILFAEDRYGGSQQSIGPVDYVENIVFVGRIADGSVKQDSETGDVVFDVLSAAEIGMRRESYPIAIEYDNDADEWYECPDLTVDRAGWHYWIWHSTIPMICDYNWSATTYEIAAQDFVTATLYQALDSFYWDRIFGRVLCNRYEQFACRIDRQMLAAAGGTTVWTLQDDDWIGQVTVKEIVEPPVSAVDLAGVFWNDALESAYMSRAPGDTSRQYGKPKQSTYLAVNSQAELNTWAGRALAYGNNRWPALTLDLAGNWRIADIWPQEYINVGALETERHTFSSDLFILREFTYAFDRSAGVLMVSTLSEAETDGVDGATVEIVEELPEYTPYEPPSFPPFTPAIPGLDEGRRIFATDNGVAATDNIGATDPTYYLTNTGFSAALDYEVWSIRRDPWRWWTSGGTLRRLYAATATGIWYMDDWPHGTWVNQVTLAAINAATGMAYTQIYYCRMDLSIETQDRYAFVFYYPGGVGAHRYWFCTVQGGAIVNVFNPVAGNFTNFWPDIKFGQHSAGQKISACYPSPDPFVPSQLYQTINFGGAWTNVDQAPAAGGDDPTISIPYIDADNTGDRFVLWGDQTGHRISESGGGVGAFSNLTAPLKTNFSRIGCGGHPDYIYLQHWDPDGNESEYSVDRGVSWTLLPQVALWNPLDRPLGCLAEWTEGVLQSVLVGNTGTATVRIIRWAQGLTAWQDKTGNFLSFATHVRDIDRDTMGAA